MASPRTSSDGPSSATRPEDPDAAGPEHRVSHAPPPFSSAAPDAPTDPTPNDDVSPLRRARIAAGYPTQLALYVALGGEGFVADKTFKRWDRGINEPRQESQRRHVAEVLQTTPQAIFPKAYEIPAATSGVPAAVDPVPGVPVAGPAEIPDFLDTVDRNTGWRPSLSTPRPSRRTAAAALTIAVILGGATIVVATGPDDPSVTATPASAAGPNTQQRADRAVGIRAQDARASQRAAMNQARDRGDFDTAITIASSLNDTAATAQLRAAAGGILARRARTAAERGDLPLAISRVDKAEKRYGDQPAIDAVRRRIAAIEDARKKRAADRVRAAKKRAADRAKAAAAARRRAPSQATTPPSSSTPSTPAPSSPSQSPSPSPSPAPSTGSSGGSSGGGSSSDKGNDPGIY